MPSFDQKKAYAPQEEKAFFDDGREIELLHFVYNLPNIDEIRGSPEKVLAAIDLFGRTKKYLMNVGEDKGKIVTELISREKPLIMVELGSYIGYSTILFASHLPPTATYISLERNPSFAAVAASLVALAGLSSSVHFEIGPSDRSLSRLARSRFDMLFLDHYKPAYVTDLKLCEDLGLVGVGTVLVADNVVKPGNPPYLEYVRASVGVKRAWAEGRGAEGVPDRRFGERQVGQYGVGEVLGRSVGRPGLVYESFLVESFEPTGEADGIEITRCVGEEE